MCALSAVTRARPTYVKFSRAGPILYVELLQTSKVTVYPFLAFLRTPIKCCCTFVMILISARNFYVSGSRYVAKTKDN